MWYGILDLQYFFLIITFECSSLFVSFCIFSHVSSFFHVWICVSYDWLDEWVDEWMVRCMNGWMDRWIRRKKYTKILNNTFLYWKQKCIPCNDRHSFTTMPIGQMEDFGAVVFQKNTDSRLIIDLSDIYYSSVISLSSFL